MEKLLKLLYDLFHKPKPGGLVFETIGDAVSPKLRDFRKENAEGLFGAAPLPKTLGRAQGMMTQFGYPDKFFTYQDGILSCVPCTIAEIKAWMNKNKYFYAWRWPYGQVPHLNGGTRFKDNMDIAKESMIFDNLLPQSQYWGGEERMQRIHFWRDGKWVRATAQETEELKKSGEPHALDGGWSYIYAKDRSAIKQAITRAPLALGIWIQDGNWHNNGIVYWDKNKPGTYGHLVALFDWDDDGKFWWISDHDGKGFKKLSYYYPLMFVAAIADKPDQLTDKKIMRIVKIADDVKYWVVGADNTRVHLSSLELFKYGVTKGLWPSTPEIIQSEDLDRIPIDEKMQALTNIESEFVKATQ